MSRVVAGAYEDGVVSANVIYLSSEDLEWRSQELAAQGKRLSLQDKMVSLSSATVAKFVDKGMMDNGAHLLEILFSDEGKQSLLSLAEDDYQAILTACAGKGKSLQESSLHTQTKPKSKSPRSRSTAAQSSTATASGANEEAKAHATQSTQSRQSKQSRKSRSSAQGNGTSSQASHWWHNRFLVVLLLLLCFPLGLIFLWLSPRFSKLAKVLWTVLVAVLLALLLKGIQGESPQANKAEITQSSESIESNKSTTQADSSRHHTTPRAGVSGTTTAADEAALRSKISVAIRPMTKKDYQSHRSDLMGAKP